MPSRTIDGETTISAYTMNLGMWASSISNGLPSHHFILSSAVLACA